MRFAAMAGAALALSGCNGVVSTMPLFFDADAVGQPQLRPGLWMTENAGCTFDVGRRVDHWPECADSFVVRTGAVVAGHDTRAPPSTWTIYPIVVARGDPPVVQITGDDGGGAPPIYMYAGLRPLKLDAHGRVIEYKVWPALCGPRPPPDPSGEHDASLTQQPIEGLVMRPASHDCLASAQAPVRASVRESEAWNGDDNQGRDRARWVRTGER